MGCGYGSASDRTSGVDSNCLARAMNLRAGTGLGRLYRIRSKNFQPNPLPKTEQMSKAELLSALASDNGALRDLAQQQLLWRSLPAGKQEIPAKRNGEQLSSQQLSEDVAGLAIDSPRPAVRAQALGLLAGLGRLDDTTLTRAAKDADPRVRRYAASLAKKPILPASTKDETDSGVLLQWALTLGNLEIIRHRGNARGDCPPCWARRLVGESLGFGIR